MTFGLRQLVETMGRLGALRLVGKHLAANDNSKNQIYLGPGFAALNVLPNLGVGPSKSGNQKVLTAPLRLFWLDLQGNSAQAPRAQLVLYPQYPEVRMSGFLQGCPLAPGKLLAGRAEGRVLILGICNDGRILAYAVSHSERVAQDFGQLRDLESEGVLSVLPSRRSNRDLLVEELGRIHRLGWIDSKRLRADGKPGPCNSPNCGGYTLEAELGVIPNSLSEPDFLGWEIKQHGVQDLNRPDSGSPVTLMTPEPTGGVYVEEGVGTFIRRFGYADRRGRSDRLNFGGIYRYGARAEITGLTITIDGFDPRTNKISDLAKGLMLVDDCGAVAALWDFKALIAMWTRKHAKAAYLLSQRRTVPVRQYRFGGVVRLYEGTDFFLLLQAISRGHVYYDPGIKMEHASSKAPAIKRRSQFRIKWDALGSLYHASEDVHL